MKKTLYLLLLLNASITFSQNQVVITYDDLILGGGFISLEHTVTVNEQILNDCRNYQVPAIGFVNEEKLMVPGETDIRKGILEKWLAAGLDLGNHTYSHPSLYRTPLEDFKADVLKGEIITRQLVEGHNKELRYFRHPFLHTGPDSTTQKEFETFLKEHGYEIAPVTVESSDYVYNKVYVDALKAGDTTLMKKVGQAYVDHTLEMFTFMESATLQVVGSPIPHIYLCHVNDLNANYMATIYKKLQERGYEFISLEEALKDPAYQSKDHYVGPWGVSWIYRWSRGEVKHWLQTEPEVDQEILSLYGS